MSGLFITFEGGEGTGKSTQIRRLAARIAASGRAVVTTREPGGSEGGESIRSLLVSGDPGRWSPEAEALLNYAARDSHLHTLVRPALAKGCVVICDRFMDSSRAYQGYAGGCDLKLIDGLDFAIVGATRPALTLVFDLDPVNGLARAKARGGAVEDRFERKGLPFHQNIRAGFLTIAAADPARCKVIDASRGEEDVADAIWAHVAPWL